MSTLAIRTRVSSLLPLVQKAATAPLLGLLAFTARRFYKWIESRTWLEIDIISHSEANRWLELWLSQHAPVQDSCTKFSLRLDTEIGPKIGRATSRSTASIPTAAGSADPTAAASKSASVGDDAAGDDDSRTDSFVAFVPRAGEQQKLRFENRTIWVAFDEGRSSKRPPPEGSHEAVTRITLSNLLASPKRNKQLVARLLRQAKLNYKDRLKAHTQIWGVHGGSEFRGGPRWRVFDARPSRPLDTVVLQPQTLGTELLSDCRRFIAHEDCELRPPASIPRQPLIDSL